MATTSRTRPQPFRALVARTKVPNALRMSPKIFIQRKKNRCFDNDYELGSLLGVGTYGDVYTCTHRVSQSERAVKIVPKSPNASDNAAVTNEFKILRELDHPNILKIYELLEDGINFYIITEIHRGGELFDLIATNGPLEEMEAAKVMFHLLSCMNYCHQKNVLHRDLKPENIMLDDTQHLEDIKLIDFGISWQKKSEKGRQTSRMSSEGEAYIPESLGTLAYMAPELLAVDDNATYTSNLIGSPKGDIWACGVIAFVILGGYVPFNGTDEEIMEMVAQAEVTYDYPVWDNVSIDAKNFIDFLLDPDDWRRPTAEEALTHPWITYHNGKQTRSSRGTARNAAGVSLGNLRVFEQKQSTLKQAVSTLIAAQLLTKEDRVRIDDVFRSLDEDCNGELDREEVEKGFREYYNAEDMTQEELDFIFSQVDTDGSGTIAYSEFMIASMWQQKLVDRKTLRAAFDLFDSDKSGDVNLEEIVKTLGLEETGDYANVAEKIMKEADSNRNGSMDFEEFAECLSRGPSKRSLGSSIECLSRGASKRSLGSTTEEPQSSSLSWNEGNFSSQMSLAKTVLEETVEEKEPVEKKKVRRGLSGKGIKRSISNRILKIFGKQQISK